MSLVEEARFGLSGATLGRVKRVFAAHPGIEKAVLYGSRAKGTHGPGSDIDLVLCGEGLTVGDLLTIDLALDELLLPYKIDLALYHKIDSRDLLDHIARVGKVVYERSGRGAR